MRIVTPLVPAPPRSPPPAVSREPFLARDFRDPAGSDAWQRTQLWAQAARARLGALGLDVGGALAGNGPQLDKAPVFGPDDAPFARIVLARSEWGGQDSRPSIVLGIGEDHVEIAVELPHADASATLLRISDPVRALELTTALEALPEQFAIGMEGEGVRAPASRASTDQIRALLDRAEREQRAIWLGWSVPREIAVANALLLDALLEDAAVALGYVFAMLAPPAGRHIAGGGAVAPPTGGLPSHRARPARRDKRDGSAGDDERPGAKRRARERDQKRDRDGVEVAFEPELREHDGATQTRPLRAGTIKAPLRASVRRNLGSASRTIEKGARVRVLEGPFFGKIGVVQELDGKGGARVILGLLAVRVDVRDLARCAEGRSRPVLSTSHRKPQPVRS